MHNCPESSECFTSLTSCPQCQISSTNKTCCNTPSDNHSSKEKNSTLKRINTDLMINEKNYYSDCYPDKMAKDRKRDEIRISKSTTPVYQSRVRGLRPHSTPATLVWLEENYEMADGVCIPRNTLYQHYVDFCSRQGLHPVNAASFGKIIRQQFPGLTTRRLGTRGQSRYHYYGIAIREGSKYYEVHYSKRGHIGIESRKESLKQLNIFQNRGKTSLPEFPSMKDLNMPQNISKDKVLTFIMMYRTHCQRILDSISRDSFDEIQSFVHHFWREIPVHLSSILNSNSLVGLIGVCDSILYRSTCNVLIPSVLQAVPERASHMIRKFTHDYDSWLHHSLALLPENLRNLKLILGRRFCKTLRRRVSLNQLCQASRMVLHSPEIINQMIQDWKQIDLDSIVQNTLFAADKQLGSLASLQLIRSMHCEFERLLEEGSQLECFFSWLEGIVERCVAGASRRSKSPLQKVAHSFLLTFKAFGKHLITDITLRSLSSFGSFHVMHLTFDEFVICLVESMYSEDRTRELLASIALDVLPDISDPCFEVESENEENITSLTFLLGRNQVGGNSPSTSISSSSSASSSCVSSSSGVSQVPLVTSSTTPALSPNIDLNIGTHSGLKGMENSLSTEDSSPVDYISTSATSNSNSLPTSNSAVITSCATPSGVIEIMGSTISAEDNYNPAESNNYYCYEYDHRSYKMSAVVGRNYWYSSPTTFNQYYNGGINTNNFGAASPGVICRDERMETGTTMDGNNTLHYSSPKTADPCYLDTSSIYYSDQSTLYASNYHSHQTYDSAHYVQKYKHKI